MSRYFCNITEDVILILFENKNYDISRSQGLVYVQLCPTCIAAPLVRD